MCPLGICCKRILLGVVWKLVMGVLEIETQLFWAWSYHVIWVFSKVWKSFSVGILFAITYDSYYFSASWIYWHCYDSIELARSVVWVIHVSKGYIYSLIFSKVSFFSLLNALVVYDDQFNFSTRMISRNLISDPFSFFPIYHETKWSWFLFPGLVMKVNFVLPTFDVGLLARSRYVDLLYLR